MILSIGIISCLGNSAIWSFAAGVGAVAVFDLLVWIIIKGFVPKGRLSPIGIITAAIASVLLLIQLVPAFAALMLKSNLADGAELANALKNSELALKIGGGILIQSPIR